LDAELTLLEKDLSAARSEGQSSAIKNEQLSAKLQQLSGNLKQELTSKLAAEKDNAELAQQIRTLNVEMMQEREREVLETLALDERNAMLQAELAKLRTKIRAGKKTMNQAFHRVSAGTESVPVLYEVLRDAFD
jgi:hypothetical protein